MQNRRTCEALCKVTICLTILFTMTLNIKSELLHSHDVFPTSRTHLMFLNCNLKRAIYECTPLYARMKVCVNHFPSFMFLWHQGKQAPIHRRLYNDAYLLFLHCHGWSLRCSLICPYRPCPPTGEGRPRGHGGRFLERLL